MTIVQAGKVLAISKDDNQIQLRNIADESLVGAFQHGGTYGYGSWIVSSKNGTMIASYSKYDDKVQIWRISDMALTATLETHSAGAYAPVTYSADGKYIVSGSWEAKIIRQASDGTLLQKILPDREGLDSYSLSPDGKSLATLEQNGPGTSGGFIQLWNIGDGRLIRTFELKYNAHAITFSPNGNMLAITVGGSNTNTPRVELLNADNGNLLRKMEMGANLEPWRIIFSPDGTKVAVTAREDCSGHCFVTTMILLWRVDDGQSLPTLKSSEVQADQAAFSPDGTIIATTGNDALDNKNFMAVILWQVRDGAIIKQITTPDALDHGFGLAFSPDNRILALGVNNDILLWRVSDGSLLATLKGHTGPLVSVAFSPDGNVLASGAVDGTVRLWGAK